MLRAFVESGLIVDVAENGQEAIKLLGIRPEKYYELIFHGYPDAGDEWV
ncbi:MAG: hypothetical protein ACLTER_05470 [Ruminococcus sp.]